jgi:hypothetical protein
VIMARVLDGPGRLPIRVIGISQLKSPCEDL